jgi:hypothetical protein
LIHHGDDRITKKVFVAGEEVWHQSCVMREDL